MDPEVLKGFKTWGEIGSLLIAILVGMGAVPLVKDFAHSWWQRRRWDSYGEFVKMWIDGKIEQQQPPLDEVHEDDLEPIVAWLMFEARFAPHEMVQLLDVAVAYARSKLLQHGIRVIASKQSSHS